MLRSLHFISKGIPGYGTPDGRCFPQSGLSGRVVSISPNSSRGDYALVSDVKFLSLRFGSRHVSPVCNASASNYRRRQDLSGQNRHGFSRNGNRHNDDLDDYEDLEKSEFFTSKNGPLHSKNGPFSSFSLNQKVKSASELSPREKEIIELFRRVQAQLRERTAMKEERKIEDSQGKSKKNETVDSLLNLLRKHSFQQGKKNSQQSGRRNFILDQTKQVEPEMEDSPRPHLSLPKLPHLSGPKSPHLNRPKSNFRKRSPVSQNKFQPGYSEAFVNSTSHRIEREISLEPEVDDIDEHDIESNVDPHFSEGNVFDELQEDETSEIYESEHDNGAGEDNSDEVSNLSGMKLVELRALAKSRGMKGFSRLKKDELVDLLTRSF